MGAWEKAYQKITDGRSVSEMTPAEIAEAEHKAREELAKLLAEKEKLT